MKKLNWKLIKDTKMKGARKAFYKCDMKLNKHKGTLLLGVDFSDDKTQWNETIKNECKYIKKEYQKSYMNQLKNGFDIICISDASTHAERLAFMGFKLPDEPEMDGLRFLNMPIAGNYTMSIHGGDVNQMWADDDYLKIISENAGFSLGEITNE